MYSSFFSEDVEKKLTILSASARNTFPTGLHDIQLAASPSELPPATSASSETRNEDEVSNPMANSVDLVESSKQLQSKALATPEELSDMQDSMGIHALGDQRMETEQEENGEHVETLADPLDTVETHTSGTPRSQTATDALVIVPERVSGPDTPIDSSGADEPSAQAVTVASHY